MLLFQAFLFFSYTFFNRWPPKFGEVAKNNPQSEVIKKIAEFAGLNPRYVSPHKIRHAFASHLLSNGADLRVIQTLLGHKNLSTTEIYTHILDEKMIKSVQENHPFAKKDFKNL